MENRAYSLLTVKAVGDDGVIRGIASTPSPDRMGDVVVPEGAKFTLPIPLLWQHDSAAPIGHVTEAKVTKAGIEIVAKIAQGVSAEIDRAWSLIKAGLVRGLSIGFRGLDAEQIPGSMGVRFKTWEWLELSAVTIPANADASITLIKSIAHEQMAASGRSDAKAEPAASGDKPKHVVRRKITMAKKSYADQIADWEETRRQKSAEMESIVADAGEGETLDAAGQEAFDALVDELKEIDGQIKRLAILQKTAVASAVEVKADARGDVGARAAVSIKAPKPAPGIQFARFARCMLLGKQAGINPVDIAKQEYAERDPHIVQMVTKANISAVNSTTDSALFGNEAGVADYVEFLRNQTIVGRFGTGGIPALRRVPFYFPVVTQATGGTAYWVAEGAAKPMTKPTWTNTELTPLVIAGLAAITLKALRFSSPDAEMALRDDLTAAVVTAIDSAFIDPTNEGTAGAKPASITNGISGTAVSGGQDADAVREDARAAMAVFVAAKNPLTSGVWIMSGTNALGLMMMQNPLGQPEFPGMTVNGGTFMGLPVIVSEAAGTTVTLLNAGDIWLADEGGVMVAMSDSASLQMVDNPTGTSTGTDPVEATLVSMFQTNSMAVRVEKFINWARRRPTGVATITAATWGTAAS